MSINLENVLQSTRKSYLHLLHCYVWHDMRLSQQVVKYVVGKLPNHAGNIWFWFLSAPLYQFCYEGWPESAERNPIFAGHEGSSRWAASSLQCILDQMWVSLSSLSQFLSKKYLWKCHGSDWRRQSRLGICIATLIIWPNSETRLIRHKITSSLSCRNSDISGRKINQPVCSLTLWDEK